CLSAKTTSWNEFSSTMALAIICLATNQKFNFSRMQDIDEEEPAEVEEVLEVVTTTKLITKVVTTAEPTTTVARVPKASAPKRRRGVVI
nr:ribonuclease H-like domain-containing protein [Tanacetum cinerariifolium]